MSKLISTSFIAHNRLDSFFKRTTLIDRCELDTWSMQRIWSESTLITTTSTMTLHASSCNLVRCSMLSCSHSLASTLERALRNTVTLVIMILRTIFLVLQSISTMIKKLKSKSKSSSFFLVVRMFTWSKTLMLIETTLSQRQWSLWFSSMMIRSISCFRTHWTHCWTCQISIDLIIATKRWRWVFRFLIVWYLFINDICVVSFDNAIACWVKIIMTLSELNKRWSEWAFVQRLKAQHILRHLTWIVLFTSTFCMTNLATKEAKQSSILSSFVTWTTSIEKEVVRWYIKSSRCRVLLWWKIVIILSCDCSTSIFSVCSMNLCLSFMLYILWQNRMMLYFSLSSLVLILISLSMLFFRTNEIWWMSSRLFRQSSENFVSKIKQSYSFNLVINKLLDSNAVYLLIFSLRQSRRYSSKLFKSSSISSVEI